MKHPVSMLTAGQVTKTGAPENPSRRGGDAGRVRTEGDVGSQAGSRSRKRGEVRSERVVCLNQAGPPTPVTKDASTVVHSLWPPDHTEAR